MRIIFVLSALFFQGLGIVIYLVLAIFIPLAPGAPMETRQEEKIEEFFTGAKQKVENLAAEVRAEKSWLSQPRILSAAFFSLSAFWPF